MAVHDRTRLTAIVQMGDCRVLAEVTNPRELSRLAAYGIKEPGTIEWIDRALGEGDVLYDIGANIGLFGIYAAMRHPGLGRVYSFEPESQNFASLNRQVLRNGLVNRVVPLCMALTREGTIDTFFIRKHLRAGEALHQLGSPVDDTGTPFDPVHTQGVVALTVDSLHQSFGLPFPTHLKIDVDGHERAVVEGSRRTMRDPRLRSVLIEITEGPEGQEIRAELLGLFEECGLTVASRVALPSHNPSQSAANYVFERTGSSVEEDQPQ